MVLVGYMAVGYRPIAEDRAGEMSGAPCGSDRAEAGPNNTRWAAPEEPGLIAPDAFGRGGFGRGGFGRGGFGRGAFRSPTPIDGNAVA